jgi:hypothetical protein
LDEPMIAEALVRGLIRLLVTVAILAAVYLFILRPVLDTTNNTIDKAFDGGGGITGQIRDQLDAANVSGLDIDLGSAGQAQRLLRCIQRADQNVEKIKRCGRRLAP